MAKTCFRCKICRPGRWQKSGATRLSTTFRTSPSIALQMSTLKMIGPYVCCPQALLMPTPLLARTPCPSVLRRDLRSDDGLTARNAEE